MLGVQQRWVEESDMDKAQAAANLGRVALLVAKNKGSNRSGHTSVVLTERGDLQADTQDCSRRTLA